MSEIGYKYLESKQGFKRCLKCGDELCNFYKWNEGKDYFRCQWCDFEIDVERFKTNLEKKWL